LELNWKDLSEAERIAIIQELHYSKKTTLTHIAKMLNVSGCYVSRFMKSHEMEVLSKRGQPKKPEKPTEEEGYVDFDYFRSKAMMVARLYPELKNQLPKAVINGPTHYQLFAKW